MSRTFAPSFLARSVESFHRRRIQPLGKHICWSGTPDQETVNVKDNDYLCLAADGRINRAQARELLRGGSGLQMSGVFLREDDHDHAHRRFERAMADFCGMGDAIFCQSGFDANVGLMQFLLNEYNDESIPVYLDLFAHMSFQVGIRAAGGRAVLFRHNDADSLIRALDRGGPGIIVVDSLYSTMGTEAPLTVLQEIARNYGSVLVVDESHSLGVAGPDGAGLCAQYGVEPDFITASMAKAFAFMGGMVLCARPEYGIAFRSLSMPAVFSSIPSPHVSARGLKTLAIIRAEEFRRERLRAGARLLRDGLRALDYPIGDTESWIIPLVIGDETETAAFRDALEEYNIFAALFAPPATSLKGNLVRLTVNCGHSHADLEYILEAFRELRADFNPSRWRGARRAGTKG